MSNILSVKKLLGVYLSIFVSTLLPISAQEISVAADNGLVKTNIHEKYYQQALYYYFQGNYSGALAIINQSKSRLNSIEPSVQLFEAGLQVKIGLQEEAKQNLRLLSSKQSEQGNTLDSTVQNASELHNKPYKIEIDHLLVLVFLSLSEQYIEQGDLNQARETLAKINHIPPSYYQQYHVLNQLAYWPEKPDLLPLTFLKNDKNVQRDNADLNRFEKHTPYIQLNQALRFIEKGNFEDAITLLSRIKKGSWQASEQSFFQLLFSDSSLSPQGYQAEEQIQFQAINDYAKLLLAYLYTQQESYEKAYVELKTFPQQSPYTESALFLYAFSAQQSKQHTTALSLLTLLHEQYPYSTLGWQASLLMAKQITEQQGLSNGWQAYQNIEKFYLNTIEQLNVFERAFANHSDLQSFSAVEIPKGVFSKKHFKTAIQTNLFATTKAYEPESIWLQQALYEPSLSHLYQQLSDATELIKNSQSLQVKSNEILDIINLNTTRKQRISASEKILAKQDVYNNLLAKRENIASKLLKAVNDPQQLGVAFANEEEQHWLDRLNMSKQNLSFIVKHSHEEDQAAIINYQERLNRLNSVLAWRLTQSFPHRSWQHKQQLIELDNTMDQLSDLQQNVSSLLSSTSRDQSESTLVPFINRQMFIKTKINPVISKLTELKEKISLKIRNKITEYCNGKRTLLAQHLLTTRKAMTVVLENMAINDEKIEKQLNQDRLNDEEKEL